MSADLPTVESAHLRALMAGIRLRLEQERRVMAAAGIDAQPRLQVLLSALASCTAEVLVSLVQPGSRHELVREMNMKLHAALLKAAASADNEEGAD